MNPYLPLDCYIPDGEPHVFGDRVYVYGSQDVFGREDYCDTKYRVFSAPVHDLQHWTDHGISFSVRGPDTALPGNEKPLYAPDVVEKDGIYYLFFCLSDGYEGVAVSARPEGPFTDPVQLYYPPDVNDGKPLCHIDPAVFRDDDGQVYLYWGQVHAQAARLTPDLRHIQPGTYQWGIIDEERHFFHEGSSVRKRNGIYYYIYCSIRTGRATSMDYATSDSPLGPFTYRGTIVENADCDPCSWNIHGSITEIDGQWYVFYHRSSNHSYFARRACVERITFEEDGSIRPVVGTSMGFETCLPAGRILPAPALCSLKGGCYLTQLDNSAQALVNITAGCRGIYRYLTFTGEETRVRIRLQSPAGGCLVIKADGEEWGRVQLQAGDWHTEEFAITSRPGTFAITLSFEEGDQIAMTTIQFLT